MVNIAEFAETYESKTTKNISELDEVAVDLALEDDEFEFTDKEGKVKVVKQKVITINKENYRVPVSVIQQLKVQMEAKPDLKKFKVKRTGTGRDDTKYTVIPLV